MQKISAVLLTYKRPENCQKIIDRYESYEIISDIILVSNDGFIPKHNPNKTKILVCNNKKGMYERYYRGLNAQNEYLFVSDDDFILSEIQIKKMFDFLINDPNKIHGFFGRKPNMLGLYAKYIDNVETSAEMVLVGLCFVHKKFFQLYVSTLDRLIFKLVFLINSLCGVNRYNGEDILFAYTVSAYTKKKHAVHKMEVEKLDEGKYSISKTRHIRFLACRTVIMWIGKIFIR